MGDMALWSLFRTMYNQHLAASKNFSNLEATCMCGRCHTHTITQTYVLALTPLKGCTPHWDRSRLEWPPSPHAPSSAQLGRLDGSNIAPGTTANHTHVSITFRKGKAANTNKNTCDVCTCMHYHRRKLGSNGATTMPAPSAHYYCSTSRLQGRFWMSAKESEREQSTTQKESNRRKKDQRLSLNQGSTVYCGVTATLWVGLGGAGSWDETGYRKVPWTKQLFAETWP